MSYKFLKNEQYYYDLYDKFTVEDCLSWEKCIDTDNKLGKAKNLFLELTLYFKKGERYTHREEVVKGWIDRDRMRDEHFEKATEPQNVLCKFCEKKMELLDKSLETYPNPERMLYRYGCRECNVLKNIYEDGNIEEVIPWKCPDCSRRLEIADKRVGNKIITSKLCTFCGYKNKYILDLRIKTKSESTLEELKEFRINKDRFCLSKKDGTNYVESVERVKRIDDLCKQKELEENKKKIKNLTLPQVERKLRKVFEKEKYVKFVLDEPSVKDDVSVPFSVQDPVKKRTELASKKLLKSVLKKSLYNTNWELTGTGINWRLGVLTGRLRGVEEKKMIY